MLELTVQTTAPREIVDVTDLVEREIRGQGDSLVHVFVRHTSAALIVSADDDELRRDILKITDAWPRSLGPFEHFQEGNPNTEAHVLSAFAGVGVLIPAREGALALGRYQRLLLLELDGPGARTLLVSMTPSGKGSV
jgi:secondary thiamine-phosphate synthase enzyme